MAVEQKRKLILMTFSSMPIPRAKVLACAVRMVTRSATPLSLIFVGKLHSEKVPRSLAKKAERLKSEGTFIEVAKVGIPLT